MGDVILDAIFWYAPIVIGLLVLVAIAMNTIVVIRPTERGLVERFGKYKRFLNPGISFIVPFVDNCYGVNVTEQMVDAEQQEVITKDNLNAKVDAQVYFKVCPNEDSVKKSQYAVNDYYVQIVALARTTLRDIIGKMAFKEVNSMREVLNQKLQGELDKQTDAWGIEVVRTELKEIEPPNTVQETMNKVLIAENEKTAAIDFATAAETKADGEKRAVIKNAQGSAEAIILQADADKKSNILRAEGVAKAIQLENEAATKYFKGSAVDYKKLLTVGQVFQNNTKVIVPDNSSIMQLISHLAAIKDEK